MKRGAIIMLWISLLQGAANRGYSQTPAQYFRKAEQAEEKGQKEDAYSFYQQAYELDTSDFEAARRYARAAVNVKYYDLASELYQRNYAKDNGKLDPDALYWIAYTDKLAGRYEDAQRNFKKYLKKHKATGTRSLVQRADQEAKSAMWALNHINDSPVICTDFFAALGVMAQSALHCSLLSQVVNTDQSEVAPFALRDTLFYSSYEGDQWKVKLAVKENGSPDSVVFGSSRDITGLTGSDVSFANFYLSGKEVFFSRSVGVSTQLMTGTYDLDALSDVHLIDLLNEKGNVNTMPFLAVVEGRRYLFFVSDREGGEGGMDIWYSLDDHGWREPRNAGRRINTPGDEISPGWFNGFMTFSSDWHEGFGGFDVFVSPFNGSTFGEPINAGKWINSSVSDISFHAGVPDYEKNELPIYFSSNRINDTSESYCCLDIYRVVLTTHKVEDQNAELGNALQRLMSELPVVLYFHNDEPNPDSWDTTTVLSYAEAYNSYLQLLPRYIRENTKGLSGEKQEDAETITNDFFELKVKAGKRDLDKFKVLLLKELESGRSLKVAVRGFASPRAQSDYNLNLTKRRTSSLVNYLMTDSAGIFLPYIEDRATNGAHLEFALLPFGEFKADNSVSDDIVDEKNSIYNRAACLERKIEIESVSVVNNSVKLPEFRIDTLFHDFGIIPRQGAVERDFRIYNDGNAPMQIDSVVAECGCTTPVMNKTLILPSDYATLHVGFDPLTRQGIDQKQVFIYIKGEEPKVLTIRAERAK